MSITDWFPTCEIEIARTESDLKEIREGYRVELSRPDHPHNAFCSFLASETTNPVAVVFIEDGITGNQLYGIVAHEATHCAMDYMQSIGEKEFSSEFIAYTVQSFVLEILRKIEVR